MGLEQHFYYSFQAGLCASGGSIFGKLSSIQFNWFENAVVQLTISAVFIVLMLLCNAAVWTFFVKALQASKSSFIPTISVSATNYVISALAGWLLFGEHLSLVWYLGTILILSGLALLASDSSHSSQDKE